MVKGAKGCVVRRRKREKKGRLEQRVTERQKLLRDGAGTSAEEKAQREIVGWGIKKMIK